MTDEERKSIIEEVLDQLRPNIQMDGGDVEFVKFQDGVVYVKMHGACIGCPASVFTLKAGIEEALRERIPDLVEVMAID